MTEPRPASPAPAAGAPMDDAPGEALKQRQVARRSKWVVAVLLVLLALGAVWTLFNRMSSAKALESGTRERARQYVQTALPKAGGAQALALPGTLQGYVQAPLSARASGYLTRWTKDIGSRVQKGEVLAEIESPEIDQQLSQATAARGQTAASLDLAKSTAARWESLRAKDVVSQQELDERRSAVNQGQANLTAADANVQRLRQLKGFKNVVAPFAGVITRRNVDVGDLIDANGGSGGRPLFVLTQTDPLRVFINVPQSYANLVKPGQAVAVTQPELPGRTFDGEVARTAAAIDTSTRTMQVEIGLPNKESALLPGAYVTVALPLSASRTLTVPSNALLFRAEGASVASVDAQGRIKLRLVTLGRNFGQDIEVVSGIEASDRVVLNPSDSINDGDQVAVAPQAAASASGGASATGPARPPDAKAAS